MARLARLASMAAVLLVASPAAAIPNCPPGTHLVLPEGNMPGGSCESDPPPDPEVVPAPSVPRPAQPATKPVPVDAATPAAPATRPPSEAPAPRSGCAVTHEPRAPHVGWLLALLGVGVTRRRSRR